jgi:hypothetical protein
VIGWDGQGHKGFHFNVMIIFHIQSFILDPLVCVTRYMLSLCEAVNFELETVRKRLTSTGFSISFDT